MPLVLLKASIPSYSHLRKCREGRRRGQDLQPPPLYLMSGGSLDYAYMRVQEIADSVLQKSENAHHRALGKHLSKISKALKILEWVLSGDSAEGEEIEAINNVLPLTCMLESVVNDAKVALADLTRVLNSSGSEDAL